MDPKILRHDTLKLEDLWYVLLYTEARLLFEENAKEYASATSALVDKAEQVRLGQLRAWRKEIIAQARVDACNESLDELTKEFEKHLYRHLEDLGVKEPTKDPRHKAYFPEALSRTVNLGLESQVQKTRFFVAAISKESAPVLSAFSMRFEKEFAKADVALSELQNAEIERRNHRLNDITGAFEEANKERQNLYGKLTSRAAERKLGRDWAEKFFRRGDTTADDPRELKRRAILLTLSARGLELSKEHRQKINAEDSDTTLNLWLSLAGTIAEVAALFA